MKPLYLGIAQEVITPKVGAKLYGYNPHTISTSVLDDLILTAYYFKQGDTQALIINATICAFANQLIEELKTALEEKVNVPADNIQIMATHTHTGPNASGGAGWGDRDIEYCDTILTPAVLRAAENAMKAPQAVRMGYATGESKVGINRRELTLENEIVLGQNPWGPIDLKMTVMSFVNEKDEPVASIVHYGCHSTAMGNRTEISRDWNGIMLDALAQKTGAPAAFFCGPEGDVGPRLSNGKTVGNIELMQELGELAAKDVLRIFDTIDTYVVPQLSVLCNKVALPLDKRMTREEAEATYEKYKEHTVNIAGLIRTRALNVLHAIDARLPEVQEKLVDQTIIKLGDCILVGTPYELFSEIGLRIQSFFKDHHVMMVINTNGSNAYLATEDALVRGGYETRVFLYREAQPYRQHTDFTYVTQTIANVQKILEE